MEQIITFVYDTGYCQSEADDPQKAVLFFYPSWVSDQQRLALCGQLMGAAQFCSVNFSTPKVFSLQSGKFVLRKYGRYILSVGSDKTLPDWILHDRFSCLDQLLQFYHNDLSTICQIDGSGYDSVMEKLSQIFELYIPILQYAVSSFGNVPTIWLPKTSSSVFLEAIQVLEYCCDMDGVVGGVILHHNRVLASQLDSELTKLLSFTDPHRIKSTAQAISTNFHLPVGVQMFRVFLPSNVLSKMKKNYSQSNTHNGLPNEEKRSSTIKRVIARIFTVPEEEENWAENVNRLTFRKQRDIFSNKWRSKKTKSKIEKNLKEKSQNFHNITSVCITPTVEKSIIHEDIVSICAGKLETKPASSGKVIPDIVQDAIKSKKQKDLLRTKICLKNKVSFDDLMIDTTHKSYPVPMRYYSIGLPSFGKDNDSVEDKKSHFYRTKFYKTITDPMYPVFRHDGTPVSKSLYNHCLEEHYKSYIAANDTIDSIEEVLKSKNLDKQLENIQKTVLNLNEKLINKNESKSPEKSKTVVLEKNEKDEILIINQIKDEPKLQPQKAFRKSLTLPLKPMSLDSDDPLDLSPTTPSHIRNKMWTTATPSTPLMTKLSLLALEEQIKDNTDPKRPEVTKRNITDKPPVKKSTLKQESSLDSNSERVPCVLFLCGQQNMTLSVILESKDEQNPDLVLSLWETGFNYLSKIENSLNKSMDHLSGNNGGNSYSFLSLDPQWGTTQRYGAWGNEELKIVGSLHQDFASAQNITEIIVRNEEAVVYGYRCGHTQTFYQQGGCASVGLPTPADLMGVITLKARRRLERDHGVVLL